MSEASMYTLLPGDFVLDFSVGKMAFGELGYCVYNKCFIQKPAHKQHIWFLQTHKANRLKNQKSCFLPTL